MIGAMTKVAMNGDLFSIDYKDFSF